MPKDLRAAELEALLHALPDIYFRLDPEGRIVDWHAGRDSELHVPPSEFIGKRQEDVLPGDVARAIQEQFARVRAERQPVTIQYTLRTPSGDDQFESRMVPLREAEAVVVIRNITGFRRAEAALRASEERLRASQKMEALGRLAGGVSHDFNNLLTVILGHVELLARELPEGIEHEASLRAYLDEIAQAAERGAALTRQLLTYGQKQRLDPKVLEVGAVINEMKGMLRRLIGEHITLETSVCGCPLKVDRVQLERVLLNLVLNARDAMPEGGTLSITSRLEHLGEEAARELGGASPGPYVVIAVSDTGCGMTPEVVSHLFEPFFTTKPVGQGTGLGLATVYGIVKQSAGHMRVRTRLGEGSTFEVLLPCVAVRPLDADRIRPASTMATGTEALLVVEDEEALRRLVTEVLGRCGYHVLTATGGEEALRVLEARPGVSLLLTDVIMSGMNGRALAARARALYPELRILLMTGYDDALVPPSPACAQERLAIIEKPFTAAGLAGRVRELLDRPPEGGPSEAGNH